MTTSGGSDDKILLYDIIIILLYYIVLYYLKICHSGEVNLFNNCNSWGGSGGSWKFLLDRGDKEKRGGGLI